MLETELNFLLTMSPRDFVHWGGTIERAIGWAKLGRVTVTEDIQPAIKTLQEMNPPPTDVICSSFSDQGYLWKRVQQESLSCQSRFHLLTGDILLRIGFPKGELPNVTSLIEVGSFSRDQFKAYFSALRAH